MSTTRTSISMPVHVKDQMDRHPNINWSAVCVAALIDYLNDTEFNPMTSVKKTISMPVELHEQMREHKSENWSRIAVSAFVDRIMELEKMQTMKADIYQKLKTEPFIQYFLDHATDEEIRQKWKEL